MSHTMVADEAIGVSLIVQHPLVIRSTLCIHVTLQYVILVSTNFCKAIHVICLHHAVKNDFSSYIQLIIQGWYSKLPMLIAQRWSC